MAFVLIVDDVAVVRIAIGLMLERSGHRVEMAGSGNEALAAVARRAPDIVVTDLWMPDLDGLALIKALRADFPAVAVVAMSGGSRQYSQQSSLDQARAAGATRLLIKPIDKSDLLAVIAATLDAQPTAVAS
jgi:two-component system chemotaxis response regulator CheY